MCVCVCNGMYTCLQFPEETRKGIRSPGVRVTSGCEPPSVGAGNGTHVLCKNGAHGLEVSLKAVSF